MQKTIHTQQGQLIRDTLRAVRQKAGLTQRELCRKLGREHSFISKCELGERRVDLAEFYWICQACGASAEREATALMQAFAALETE